MQFDLKNAIIRLEDGTQPIKKFTEITVSEGNLSYTEHKPREYTLNRGRLKTVRNADEQPMDVSITAIWEELTGLVNVDGVDLPAFEDALKRKNSANDWVSSSDDPCEPYAVDLVIYLQPDCGAEGAQKITIPDFRYESLNHAGGDATIAIEGKSNALEAIIERLVASLTNVAVTPTTIAAGGNITVTWDAEWIPGEVNIYLVPALGPEIKLGNATARAETATVQIPSGTTAGSYDIKVIGAIMTDMEGTASITVS